MRIGSLFGFLRVAALVPAYAFPGAETASIQEIFGVWESHRQERQASDSHSPERQHPTGAGSPNARIF